MSVKVDLLPGHIASARPFRWGECDCCTFAADWLILLGRPDPMADLRGYTTARQALRLYRSGLLSMAKDRLGEPMANPLFAQRGDVAIVELEDGREAAGVVVGESVAVPGHAGLVFLPLTVIMAAWSV